MVQGERNRRGMNGSVICDRGVDETVERLTLRYEKNECVRKKMSYKVIEEVGVDG